MAATNGLCAYDIYGIGAALVDTEIAVSDDDLINSGVDKGVMTLVDEQRQHELIAKFSRHLIASKRASGGSAANTIIAASYFGANNFYSCRVANDDNGDFYINAIRAAGVSLPPTSGGQIGITGKCLVMITPDAERTMNTFLGISESICIDDLYLPAIRSAKYVYIEGYLVSSQTGRAAAIELRRYAQVHGVNVALSLSDPAMVNFFREGLQSVIGDKVELLFCNADEALSFTQTTTLEAAVTQLKNYAHEFVITRGKQGALLFDGADLLEIAATRVKAVDTNGAGDMFAGAYLYGLTHNYSHEQAGKLASAAAAKVVSQFGPRLAPEQHQEILDQYDNAH